MPGEPRTLALAPGGAMRLRWAAWGVMAAGMVTVSLLLAPGPTGWLGAALAIIMLAIAVIDWHRFIIPDPLNALGLVLGLIAAATAAPEAWTEALAVALLRAAVLAGCFLLLRLGYRRLRGRDGLGLGDVKLAGVAGAWLDWPMLPIAVQIAALSALAGALLAGHARGQALHARTRVPFGLFLAPAIWLVWALQTALPLLAD